MTPNSHEILIEFVAQDGISSTSFLREKTHDITEISRELKARMHSQTAMLGVGEMPSCPEANEIPVPLEDLESDPPSLAEQERVIHAIAQEVIQRVG